MECADGDNKIVFTGMPFTVINKIVFTSPETMVEFSGGKKKPRQWSKPFEHIQIYIYYLSERSIILDLFSLEQDKQKSQIANHPTTLCKECEIKSLTTQALSQLWITQSLLFPILTVSG